MLDRQSRSGDTNASAGSGEHSDASAGRSPTPGKIGFVGLGHMGTAMAANLAAAGCHVVGYVRRQELIDKVQGIGVTPTMDIAELFDCEIVISMLPDDTAVRSVVFGGQNIANGLAAGLPPGAIHLSMSTISTAAAAEFASEHARRGQGYVAAPVFGNPDAAKARQLFIIAAGAAIDAERCRLLMDNLGQTFVVGDDPTQANLIKLLGNMMTATALEVLGEIVAVLRKRGLDPRRFIDILTSTMFAGRVHRIYGNKIVEQSYAPGFTMPLALKDVRLALAEAEKGGVAVPSIRVVRDRLITGIARGHAGLDWTALALVAAEESEIDDRANVKLNGCRTDA
jgi:3-hydroxyisobutyrate dehydrogenase-like beta-hydroxyacid dehydrogenase